jgi:alkanesulfonate monooxygenase SsuD/methylene tetrahydromethanopterin reductase-like flavin-dependent oxidoreductase (luciferase family)
MLMELGVTGLNAKATLGPAETVRLARRAEELGYGSWWAGDHVVLPSVLVSAAPMEATDPILDPLVHLAYVAAVTERLELGTPGSSSCRGAIRWCSPSRLRASMCSAAAG